ncbi:hypothetical protein I5589_18730 [Burkholderia vietnamiensis]|uniref:Uncharacterized protein n=1 Tax=Burkholderia vietnamiensis TaxID=60552 RepID=A0ABS1AYA2_BURVI|nr:hypothetical protein [Burkholderia vietnamiensis]MBJ9689114.1 hypothetical protein [Burkholderia vietnamiensis]
MSLEHGLGSDAPRKMTPEFPWRICELLVRKHVHSFSDAILRKSLHHREAMQARLGRSARDEQTRRLKTAIKIAVFILDDQLEMTRRKVGRAHANGEAGGASTTATRSS